MAIIHFLLNCKPFIESWINSFGIMVYVLLFLIIFCETGLVFLPFLPGDSVIFAVGALAGLGSLNIYALFIVLFFAAVLGDTVNYEIGKHLGRKIVEYEKIKLIKEENLQKADAFIAKYGGKAIFLARFVPIIRTIVPFVIGTGKYDYKKFIRSNALGGFVWVTLFLGIGFFLGNLKFVQTHFSLILLFIIFLSVLPIIIGVFNAKFLKKKSK